MRKPILSLLRNKYTTTEEFRRASDQMGTVLSFEVADILDSKEQPIETPLGPTTGYKLDQPLVLLPILRAGLALLNPFLRLFPTSRVGFVGVKRDEETARPLLYYKNIPEITKEDRVIILDPMIATGGSGGLVLEILKAQGIKEEQIIYVGVIAAPEGIDSLRKIAPSIKLICAEIDQRLNDKKFIVPGLGDFGDRYFGT